MAHVGMTIPQKISEFSLLGSWLVAISVLKEASLTLVDRWNFLWELQ